MPLSKQLVKAARSVASRIPGGELRARSLYHRRRIVRGVRLLCYAKQKSTFEWFSELGAGVGEVDVETLYTAMNVGTERARYFRLPNTFTEFPYTPSSPGVGRVIRTGRKVTNLRPGDMVIGLFKNASLQRLTANGLIKIDGIPLEDAAMIRLGIVAIQGLRMGRVRSGQRVLVMGQGIIGRLATLLARAEGVEEVFCLTRSPDKLRALGESQGIALADANARQELEEMRADVVIEATGDPLAINAAVQAAKEGGRVVLLGSSRGITKAFDMNGPVMQKGITVIGAHRKNLSSMPPELGGDYRKEVNQIVQLLREEKLSLSELITHRMPCEDLAESYSRDLLDSPDLCGAIVDWTASKRLMAKQPAELNLTGRETSAPATSRLRIGLVGCGGIGVVNAAAIAHSASAELAVCMDTNRTLADDLGSRYSVPGTDTMEVLLRDPTIDAVFVATPHHLHAPLAIQAAAAGKHVLVEKPLATSIADASAMVDAARDNRVLLRAFLSRKYRLPYLVARRLIERDAVGRLIGVSISSYVDQSQSYWTGGRRGRSQSDWRACPIQSGGGVLIMNLVHDFDALHYVTGISIGSVFGNCGTLYHPVEVEDTVGLTFTGSCGAIGTVSAGNAVKGGGGSCLRVWGENGQLVIEKDTVWFRSLRPIGQYTAQRSHTIQCRDGAAHDPRATCVDEFVHEVSRGEATDFSEPGYRALAVVMAAYESAKVGRPVDISNGESRDARCEIRDTSRSVAEKRQTTHETAEEIAGFVRTS